MLIFFLGVFHFVIAGLTRNPQNLAKLRGSRGKPGMTVSAGFETRLLLYNNIHILPFAHAGDRRGVDSFLL